MTSATQNIHIKANRKNTTQAHNENRNLKKKRGKREKSKLIKKTTN